MKVTYFKVSHDVTLDWYYLTAGVWSKLGGDFLTPGNDNPEGLESVLKKEILSYENPPLEDTSIEYR